MPSQCKKQTLEAAQAHSTVSRSNASVLDAVFCLDLPSVYIASSAGSHRGRVIVARPANMQEGANSVASALIAAGTSLDLVDSENGWTALLSSVYFRHYIMAQILFKAGASCDVKAKAGDTVKDVAEETSEAMLLQTDCTRIVAGVDWR